MLFKMFFKIVVDFVLMNQLKLLKANTKVWTIYTEVS